MSSVQKPIRPMLPEHDVEIREKAQYLISNGYVHDTLENVMRRLKNAIKNVK
jgi:hypothetical protein